jgi:hypothetical protein
MEPAEDTVYTIDDWYDGPRGGAADYQGAPHWYRSVYLDREDEPWNPDEDRFELTPLGAEALAWERERSAIFDRWDQARKAGTVEWDGDDATHGAFPGDRERSRELDRRMEEYLAEHRPVALVRGTFALGCKTVRWRFVHAL